MTDDELRALFTDRFVTNDGTRLTGLFNRPFVQEALLNALRAVATRCRYVQSDSAAIILLREIVDEWDEAQSKRTQSLADVPWHIQQARKLIGQSLICESSEGKADLWKALHDCEEAGRKALANPCCGEPHCDD